MDADTQTISPPLQARSTPSRVVAIGASAGGLESLQQLFGGLAADTGMCFVVVQHLSPDFKSLMPELLARHTPMQVVSVDHDFTLEPNTVYVLAAGFSVALQGGQLRVLPRPVHGELHHPINMMFESLAPLGEHAAAVVLSGTGQDGVVGARLVRKSGGLVIAQVPTSARFDSMPRAVIDADCADIVALPSEIGRALGLWLEDPQGGRRFTSEAADGDSLLTGPYGPVLKLLQSAFDIDFSHYKAGTIMRRIDRWLTVGGDPITQVQLAERLEGNLPELDRLFGDLLIGVTGFFRDVQPFDALSMHGIEPKIDALGERDHLRLWSCACSTGEEAYTLAMLAVEAFDRRGLPPRVRVLATDAHAASVQRASAGLYTDEALLSVPAPLRDKYFVQQASGLFKVVESLRRCVVFSVHNVLRDAPFQRVDVIACRNLLIYLRAPAQGQVLAQFHGALNAGGTLLLGKSEMPSEHGEAFESIDDSAHLYRKRPGLQLPISARPIYGLPPAPRPAGGAQLDNRASHRLQEVLAQRYVPSGFLVNQNDELVYVFGDAGRHLSAAPGRFGGGMFTLLSGTLRTAVTMALRKASNSSETVAVADVILDEAEPTHRVRIEVDRISDRSLPLTYFMVRMVPQTLAPTPQPAPATTPLPDDVTAQHILDLEAELLRTREALQRSIEDLESANEELQAGNEELMAANEELQSSNEELHAVNEELYSVNAEHELKIQELRETSADLNNLILATDLAIIFLDMEGRLRLFTPAATQLFPLRPSDIGRELRDFLPREADPHLFEDVARVLHSGQPVDAELKLADGSRMRRRVAAYRTEQSHTAGAVLTYVDVTQQVTVAEQALELASREREKAIIESVPHLMWTCRADGECDFLSPQWVAYTGLPEAPQLGQGWLQQIHVDDREQLMAAWNQSVQTGLPFRTRFRIRRHDGQYRWFDTQGIPQLDAQRHIVKWYGSNTDVHDITLLQNAVEERERFAQMVADSINGMVGYWDREQRNRFANSHYREWFGKDHGQMQGLTLRQVLGDEVYELNRPHIEAALRGQPQVFERSINRPDGSIGHLLAEYRPHVVDGQVLGFVATATDVTRVQEARVLADRVFQVSPVTKLIVDATGHIIRWNPAAERLLGYATDQLNGLSIEQLLPADRRQRHRTLRLGYMSAPTHRPMGSGGGQFPLLRADGSVVNVDIELSPVTVDGQPAAIACVREALVSPYAAQQLDKAVQARSAFLAQMSHEIRTPLNAILGMTQLLQLEAPTSKQLDRLRRIDEASNHLMGVVNDILDYSKMEAGKVTLHAAPFSLHALLDRSLALVTDPARLKQLTLRAQVAPDVPDRLVGDAQRIEQILANFLSNAVKFTPQGSITVRVTSTSASDHRVVLRIEVKDTGIGIDSHDLTELFTPFRQVGQGNARRFGGTGLGLAISRKLAQAMHGDCGVTSAPGQGSTFWFTVQLERGEAPAPATSAPAPEPAAHTAKALCKGRRVLLVEDNPVNRIVASDLIDAVLGVMPDTAEDGHDALAQAQATPYDLVLMDIQLPDIDGFETTRRMRQLAGYDRVPIVALTANVLADDVNACIAAGMNAHLGKPMMAADLRQLILGLWGPAPSSTG